ncbi:MAG: leucine-rich repeat domain-containing protein [Mycoplasmoidaceae bacterium]|nr:leucine-rich repeat domain-containing protein [Mycoplasmoidaceae bacterium]
MAFEYATSLNHVKFESEQGSSSRIERIGEDAFANCTNLLSVDLSDIDASCIKYNDNVEFFENDCFDNCDFVNGKEDQGLVLPSDSVGYA